jgi:hypothetical protein
MYGYTVRIAMPVSFGAKVTSSAIIIYGYAQVGSNPAFILTVPGRRSGAK